MKQKLQLQIPEPCHENWDVMTPAQQGRFCSACQKQVVDFSVMTDKEILAHIAAASSNICGRAGNDQLSRDLLAPAEPRKIGWKYWIGIAASFIMITAKSNGQVKGAKAPIVAQPPALTKGELVTITMGKIAASTRPAIPLAIHGIVTDDKNKPIPYATVNIKDNYSAVSADSSGNFILDLKPGVEQLELTISSVGYELKNIAINKNDYIPVRTANNKQRIDIENIILSGQPMKDVVITGYSNQRLYATTGAIAICRKMTVYQKAKTVVKDSLGINEIKIFPNPIVANTNFNIGFKLKEQGDYAVQFTDVSGKVIAAKQLYVTAKSQVENFNSNIFPLRGIYFVSVRGKQSSKVYTAKLLVQ